MNSIPVILGTDTFGTTDPATEDVTAEPLSNGETALVSIEDGELLGIIACPESVTGQHVEGFLGFCRHCGADVLEEDEEDDYFGGDQPEATTSPWVRRNIAGQQVTKARGSK